MDINKLSKKEITSEIHKIIDFIGVPIDRNISLSDFICNHISKYTNDKTQLLDRNVCIDVINDLLDNKMDFSVFLISFNELDKLNEIYGREKVDITVSSLLKKTKDFFVYSFENKQISSEIFKVSGSNFIVLVSPSLADKQCKDLTCNLQLALKNPVILTAQGVPTTMSTAFSFIPMASEYHSAKDVLTNLVCVNEMILNNFEKTSANSVSSIDKLSVMSITEFKKKKQLPYSKDDIHKGIVATEFTPHFQPIYMIGEGKTPFLSGFEALARWKKDKSFFGNSVAGKIFVPPGIFITVTDNKVFFPPDKFIPVEDNKITITEDISIRLEDWDVFIPHSSFISAEDGYVNILAGTYKVIENGKVFIPPDIFIPVGQDGMALIPPGIFIPIAEDNGIIELIDKFIIKEAISCTKEWNLNNNIVPITLSLNASLKTLQSKNFVDFLKEQTEQGNSKNFSTDLLILEVVESLLITEWNEALNLLNQIKKLGIKIALDDFGTEYSSLRYLWQLPIDFLKIDQSFISKMLTGKITDEEDTKVKKLVNSILKMANELGILTVAEGIETKEQLEWLQEQGCYKGQGWLKALGKPMSKEEATLLIEKEKIRIAELKK